MQTTTKVLGKRKARTQDLVLHLESAESEPEPSTSKLIIINGTLVQDTKKKYKCTSSGCGKAYTKPSRLEEHERSHSGVRPFVCGTCQKSYLRETHLQAHVRSHLPESDRPFGCSRTECEKRFWTAQHLKVHEDGHDGAKAFPCPKENCTEEFSKHNQLRVHIASEHAPPGTKPFRCEHPGCTKSFQMNQQLKTHAKTHDEKRYTCSHPNCLPTPASPLMFYAKWTELQHHVRIAHPPTCTHPSCLAKSEDGQGRVFASQKGLRAHQKLHEGRDMEEEHDDSDDEEGPPSKKRRGGELGRDWKCTEVDCEKDFKSKKALTTHVNVTHLGCRDHVCPHQDCGSTFGYKHLLQRHVAKIHPSEDEDEGEETATATEDENAKTQMNIDFITGKAYADRATEKLATKKGLRCPWPDVHGLVEDAAVAGSKGCEYVFSRAYDLRRHLKGTHELEADKEVVDGWVLNKRKQKREAVDVEI